MLFGGESTKALFGAFGVASGLMRLIAQHVGACVRRVRVASLRRAMGSGRGEPVRRAYVWSHHIYAKRKKREIPDLAKRLGLGGFCSTGKPGFIVVEGCPDSVKRFLVTIKRWPWQRLIVRLQEDGDEPSFDGFEMTGASGGEKNDLKQVRVRFQDAGLGSRFAAVAGFGENDEKPDSGVNVD